MMRRACRKLAVMGSYKLPPIVNEPSLDYAPGSVERQLVADSCAALRARPPQDIPIVIGGREIRSGEQREARMPSDHSKVLATYWWADEKTMQQAIEASMEARSAWGRMPFNHRAAIMLKAADLLVSKRGEVMATSMLDQAKTVLQADIDVMAELADFIRFNVKYAHDLYNTQPSSDVKSPHWNYIDYRPLDGFVFAVAPFNFMAIVGNICSAPALMGNTVILKPSDNNLVTSYLVYQVLLEAGVPPGVINFVPCAPPVAESALRSQHLAAINFTGSTRTFKRMWKVVGESLDGYRAYPRLVGECGGKNFHMVHNSADIVNVVNQTTRASFEFSGQKCSACSRLYAPASKWEEIKAGLVEKAESIQMGQPDDFTTFTSAVIDEVAYDRVMGYIDRAKEDPDCTILAGGTGDRSVGWMVRPTIIQTTNSQHALMQEEVFGPLLAVYVYDDSTSTAFDEVMKLADTTSPYGLTGAIFAQDRLVLDHANNTLQEAAGNFYINDKCTGSVVGQQPFGGSRMSGTNDKAGFGSYVGRWVSPRSTKENFISITDIHYPSTKE